MARIMTDAAELRSVASGGFGWTTTGTVTVNTNFPHTGAAAHSMAAASSYLNRGIAGASNTAYYMRAYIRPSANPTNQVMLMRLYAATGGINLGEIYMETNGTLTLRLNGQAAIATSAAIPVITYSMVELGVSYPTVGSAATISMRLNGVQVGSSGAGTTTLPDSGGGAFFGVIGAGAPGTTFLFDDIAVNNSTGTDQNSWPGPGKIAMLFPVSDTATRVGWTAGAAGTTNLWDALNNTPPTGVAQASATTTSQILTTGNNITDNYIANLATFASAGISPYDQIALVVPVASRGAGTGATVVSMGLTPVSNPAGAEVLDSTAAAAAGAWPTNWGWHSMTPIYNPNIRTTENPKLQVRRNTASATALMVASMGMLVEYNPGAKGLILPQSIQRASLV